MTARCGANPLLSLEASAGRTTSVRVCGALGHVHPCVKPAAQVMIPHSTSPFLRRVCVFRGSMGASGGTGLGTRVSRSDLPRPPGATSQPSHGFQFVLPRGHVLAGPFFLKQNLKVGEKLAKGHKPGTASPAPRARGLPATLSPIGLPCSSATWKEVEAPLPRAAPADRPPRGTGHLQGHEPLSRPRGGGTWG